MTARRRILFFAEGATMAHFVRPLALARSLDTSQYEVHFYAPARFKQHTQRLPFATGVLNSMPSETFLDNIARGKPLFPIDVLRSYVLEDRELIRAIRPDLVVGDMRLSLPIGAQLEEVASAMIINAYWSPYAKRRSIIPELPLTRVIPPRFLNGVYKAVEPIAFAMHMAQMNRVRREFGLPALAADVRLLYTTGNSILYADIPEFLPTPGAPASHQYVGICNWAPEVPKPAWWKEMAEDSRPKVFVSLGSSGPLRVLPALLKALANFPVAVVLSTSGRKLPPVGNDVYLADLLPFTETAAVSRLVISHGGSGGLYPAIAAGTPVLGIPSNADQQLSTAVLEDNGAGLGVRVEEASESRLRTALGKLLNDSSYFAAAQTWKSIFAKYDSGVMFDRFLNEVLPSERIAAVPERQQA